MHSSSRCILTGRTPWSQTSGGWQLCPQGWGWAFWQIQCPVLAAELGSAHLLLISSRSSPRETLPRIHPWRSHSEFRHLFSGWSLPESICSSTPKFSGHGRLDWMELTMNWNEWNITQYWKWCLCMGSCLGHWKVERAMVSVHGWFPAQSMGSRKDNGACALWGSDSLIGRQRGQWCVHSGDQSPSMEGREVAHSVLCRISVRVSEVWKK